MAKKLIAFLLVLICTVSVVWGFSYVKQSGLFEPYPEPEYLTESEAELRPLYQHLSRKEKALYTAMYRGVCEFEDEISLPYEIDGDLYSKLYCLLEKQEGELFFIDSTYYTAQKLRTATIISRDEAEDEYPEMSADFAEKVDEILAEIPKSADDFEKALYIHDYIVQNCTYEIDEEGYNATAYGCLVEGVAHCEGYAKAFSHLAQKAGICSIIVTGITDEGENHAWNQVEIDGEWYNVDVTWDDTDTDSYSRHMYFLSADEDFGRTHFADNMYFEPFGCRNTKDNFYIRNDLYIEDEDDAERILGRAAASGSDMLEMSFADKDIYEDFIETFVEGERVFEIIVDNGVLPPGERLTISMKEYEKELCIMLELP